MQLNRKALNLFDSNPMEGGDCRRPASDANEEAAVASRPSSRKRKAIEDLEEEEEVDLQPEEESRPPAPPAKGLSCLPAACHEDGIIPAFVIPGSKHRDGSIYRKDAHYWHGLYHLDDTSETRLEPMTPSYSEQDCRPCVTDCQWHIGCSMMQIFSLELAEISNFATGAAGAGAIQLYGFMAARDLLDPLRNYVFNRTRDDPFTIRDVSYPFIQMTGPKRGITMNSRVMIEYDLRIKRGENEQDDLVLIDGAATFSEITNFIPYIYRIHGDCGMAVDITLAHFILAIEATLQVRIYELKDGCGSLNLTITCRVSHMTPQIKLFQDPIDKLRDQNRFVVVATLNTLMITEFKLTQQHGSISRRFESRVVPHGSMSHCAKFADLATIGVEIFCCRIRCNNLQVVNEMWASWELPEGSISAGAVLNCKLYDFCGEERDLSEMDAAHLIREFDITELDKAGSYLKDVLFYMSQKRQYPNRAGPTPLPWGIDSPTNADDTVIFIPYLAVTKFLLYCFEDMSGLKINYDKGKVLPNEVSSFTHQPQKWSRSMRKGEEAQAESMAVKILEVTLV
ncbi:hypothetical protein OsI_37817 [Oryza sativa Indica Group]|uniref:DUF6598 domain-containing protein n=1 Tax=Oryza sativa subsp. indica TaxID=39946 RepID=B8BNN0_ORYSI|nr:hypothetical protein OsI_37817 [Oryza sativa Indica Group]